MTQQTDYNSLEHPTPHEVSDIDAGQWAEILSGLFEDGVDELLIRRGTLSNRPAAGGSTDFSRPRLYISTDQDPPLLSIDTESQGWLDLNDLNNYAALGQNETITGTWTFNNAVSTPELAGGVTDSQPITKMDGQNLSIDGSGALNSSDSVTTATNATKTFGAMVNGSHSDFSSAQAAIDFAEANGKSVVTFGRSTQGAISIPPGIRVSGSAQVGTASVSATTFQDSVTDGGVVHVGRGSVIENCRVINDGTGTGDHCVTGENISTVTNVRFGGAGGDGFNFANVNASVTLCSARTAEIGGASVVLTSNSGGNIVTNNRSVGTITDNGTGNIVNNNT